MYFHASNVECVWLLLSQHEGLLHLPALSRSDQLCRSSKTSAAAALARLECRDVSRWTVHISLEGVYQVERLDLT